MREKADKVKDVLEKRMSKTAAIVVSAVIILLTLMLYAPFIVSNLSSSETIATSLGMLGVILAILAVALVVTLIVLKLPLREAVKDFQSTMHFVADEINDRKCTSEDFTKGMIRFVYGLSNKIIVSLMLCNLSPYKALSCKYRSFVFLTFL